MFVIADVSYISLASVEPCLYDVFIPHTRSRCHDFPITIIPNELNQQCKELHGYHMQKFALASHFARR